MAAEFPYHPLKTGKDLDVLLDEIGDAQVVMLGEASHGTSEYYTWRTAISRRLIEEKGFTFIAVEGDWPDCFEVNRYVKGYNKNYKSVHDVLKTFDRWPSWMWANWEVAALAEWLHEYNQNMPNHQCKAGFYGLDVYSLWESLEQVMHYLENHDGEAAKAAEKAFNCFEPFNKDPQLYAQATALVPKSCEDEVVEMLQKISEKKQVVADEPEADFNTTQNALVAVNAEKYYRAMIRGGSSSWNVRDHHMMETLNRLMEFHGPGAKAIVWEHNTHIGDAVYTDMRGDDMVNIGQLAREAYGRNNVRLVGFGSYQGTV
ncbi:MAG: erythromycin esterase family protein, partial [Hymenobacteraceae bacterium]|nr:erythromycin esterase family protein [Hymenobacteraceae bacterium]MDX5395885.1 erythromycin esterase family protein [Hymenobacteraceae bacterium]MDX5442526.1 erythromycin esterase family protein [Hymenobacteraceae bacterium]MDX5511940.1 erythromycin esterase family protein [Hymenobacteraceae bacterium]